MDAGTNERHKNIIRNILNGAAKLKLSIQNHVLDPRHVKQLTFHPVDLANFKELANTSSIIKSSQIGFLATVEKRLFTLSREIESPIVSYRSIKDQEILLKHKDDVFSHNETAGNLQSNFPSHFNDSALPVYLYNSTDVLNTLKKLNIKANPPLQGSLLSSFSISAFTTRTLETLQLAFRELHPSCKQVGVQDIGDDLAAIESFVTFRSDIGDEIIDGCSSQMAAQFAKQGCPQSCRAKIWDLAIQSNRFENPQTQVNKICHNLRKELARLDLLIDKIIQVESKNCQSDDQYFVFEDKLKDILLYWSRDTWFRDRQPEKSVSIGQVDEIPNGIPPVWGLSLYAMPICYLQSDAASAYITFREMYQRYFRGLHSIEDNERSLLYQCVLFENLVKEANASLYLHLLTTLGVEPIDIAAKWIFYAFVGILDVDQVLLMWDRIVGFNSVDIVALTAAALLCFRSDMIMQCQNIQEVHVSFTNSVMLCRLGLDQMGTFGPAFFILLLRIIVISIFKSVLNAVSSIFISLLHAVSSITHCLAQGFNMLPNSSRTLLQSL